MSDPYRSPEYSIDREDSPRRSGVRRPGGLTAPKIKQLFDESQRSSA
jgi:hypothetical protein